MNKLVDDIQAQFPEVEYLYTTPGVENPAELWIHVTAPDDEEREIALIEYGSDKAMDILLEYGYPMLIMLVHKSNGVKAQNYELKSQP